jgi:hypothetical protein
LAPLSSASASSAADTFVKVYAKVSSQPQYAGVFNVDVQATSDGGKIVLALTQSSTGVGVTWVVKLDATGVPQWQREVGCLTGAPGDYADAVSVQQTADGGYVLGGGTIDCGSKGSCPALSGRTCALVDKLAPNGSLEWARAYAAGSSSSAIDQIRQTSDGGYIAAGSTTAANQSNGALIMRLDSAGKVLWQRALGPTTSTQAYFNSVQVALDGGYVAAGVYQTGTQSSVLAVKFDRNGTILWQRAFNNLDSRGTPIGFARAFSIADTADGGYAVAGQMANNQTPGVCCWGGLLLKLDSTGAIKWQTAYSGGRYCYSNGLNETCVNVAPTINSVRQSVDGGYLLAGDDSLELTDSAPIEPWLAQVSPTGQLVWQHFYYRINPVSQRPIGGEMSGATTSQSGGAFGLGFTENLKNGIQELYGVNTNSSGTVTACSEVHDATALAQILPGLAGFAPTLGISDSITPNNVSPATTTPTLISVSRDC